MRPMRVLATGAESPCAKIRRSKERETTMSSVVQLRPRARRALIHAVTAGLVLTAGLTSNQAHAWPDRTVKLVTPGSAGSHTDAIARLLADGMSKKWGVAVVVENQPGVDGIPAV